jgi:hypothetical protein
MPSQAIIVDIDMADFSALTPALDRLTPSCPVLPCPIFERWVAKMVAGCRGTSFQFFGFGALG